MSEINEKLNLTVEDWQKFKELFSKYCGQEINKGHCPDGSCSTCPVNAAYSEIFSECEDEADNDDEEE